MISWQVRAIIRPSYPAIRAVQSLASTTTQFLLSFASTYFILSLADAAMFTEPLTRSDALYFTVTMFSRRSGLATSPHKPRRLATPSWSGLIVRSHPK